MQLAVIDDLITVAKQQIEQNAPISKLDRINKTLYVLGFVDCAYKCEVISKADYDDFIAAITAIRG